MRKSKKGIRKDRSVAQILQVESLCREVASLRTTLQSKHRQYQKLTNSLNHSQRQHQQWEQTEDSVGSDGSLTDAWSNFNDDKSSDGPNNHSQNKELAALNFALQRKEKSLNERQSKIDKMEEELLELEEKQKELMKLADEGFIDKKLLLAARSQEQLEEILRRKNSLSLNLKRALPASPDDRSSSSDDMVTSSEMHSCQDDDDILSRKKKIAAALHLMYDDLPSTIDTIETFHTAAADSPDIRLQFSNFDAAHNETMDSQTTNDNGINEESKSDNDLDFQTSSAEIQVFPPEQPEQNCSIHESEEKDNVSPENESIVLESVDDILQRSPTMQRLNKRIAKQRLLVMKCLQDSPPSKEELNRQIATLQDLKKQQIDLEVSLLEQERKSQKRNSSESSNEHERILASNDSLCENFKDRPFCRQFDATSNSSASLSTATTTRSHPRTSIDDDEHLRSLQIVSRVPQGRGFSTVYLTSQARSDRLTSPYALTITRSLPSLIGNEYDSEAVINVIISVPSYVVRGAGTSSHYEYEVRVVAQDDSWTLLRRYRRFRELYVSMRQKYGSKVSTIRFPPRQIMFARYEMIARQRRQRLEDYLRRLILVCSELPACEPLYKYNGNLNNIDKQSLLEFSPFFRRGTFESSKYGTS